jgi:hypothetical protein
MDPESTWKEVTRSLVMNRYSRKAMSRILSRGNRNPRPKRVVKRLL